MKRHALASWIVAITLSTAAGAASAQSAVNGPYYATPSWDQTLPASTRFLVLSNFNGDAVLDRETGLVWQRALQPLTAQYATAVSTCLIAKTGGRYGWRVPTMPELISLFDPSVTAVPALPVGHPFTAIPSPLFLAVWSSTPYPDLSGHFRLINTTTTFFVQNTPDNTFGNFLCVRSPGSSNS